MTSHYTWGSVTRVHDFGGVLGRPFGHFLLGSHNFMVTAIGVVCDVALRVAGASGHGSSRANLGSVRPAINNSPTSPCVVTRSWSLVASHMARPMFWPPPKSSSFHRQWRHSHVPKRFVVKQPPTTAFLKLEFLQALGLCILLVHFTSHTPFLIAFLDGDSHPSWTLILVLELTPMMKSCKSWKMISF